LRRPFFSLNTGHDVGCKEIFKERTMVFKMNRLWADVVVLAGCGVMCSALPVLAQERIYRCGNEYTNAPINPKTCEIMQGQTITVIEGTRPSGAPRLPVSPSVSERTKTEPSLTLCAPSLGVQGVAAVPAAQSGGGLEPVDAKYREAQKRIILVAELKQTRERHAQLVQEYNAGEPDKVGGEARNHQKYLDRLAGLKAGIARAERDMDSLQRELARLPSTQVALP
jgi:hypothetical protein